MSDTRLAFRIRFDSRYYGSQSHSITASIVGLPDYDDNGNRDLSYDKTVWDSDSEFNKVKVEAYTSRDSLATEKQNPMYGMQYTWEGSDLTLCEIEKAIKPMRKISKFMDNAYEVSGNPITFGQYLLRVMKACKVGDALIEVDGKWKLVMVSTACRMVDERIQEWQSEARKFSALV